MENGSHGNGFKIMVLVVLWLVELGHAQTFAGIVILRALPLVQSLQLLPGFTANS